MFKWNTLVVRMLDAHGKNATTDAWEEDGIMADSLIVGEPTDQYILTLFGCMERCLTDGVTTEVMGWWPETAHNQHARDMRTAVERAGQWLEA